MDGLERALLEGDIDLAVHSAKDLPGELAPGLALLGAPERAGAEDALCGAGGLAALAPGARVGTSSLRRVAQLRSARPDLEVVPVRGNVDTRLAKLAAPAERPRRDRARACGPPAARARGRGERPAGPRALRARAGPGRARAAGARRTTRRAGEAAERITDAAALAALRAERALARALGADCHTALGAHAQTRGEDLLLRGWVGLPDGSAWALDEQAGAHDEPEALGELVAARLRAVGAQELLEGAREVAQAGDGG